MQLAGLGARFAIYDFNIPNWLTIAVGVGLTDLARTNLITQIDAHIVISDLARFGLADIQRMRLALQKGPYLSRDGARFERLAIVFQDFVIDGVAGFRAQVAGELARGVHFHADGALAFLENVDRFLLMEREEILEMKLIGADTRGVQLLDGFANDASGGAPADQRYFGIGRAFQARRREIFERQIQLLHTLLGDLAANRGIAENIADQNAPLVVFVGSSNVHGIGRAWKRARRNAGLRELISFVVADLAV